ncbi:MAG: hypothetical protein R3Y15_03780 [Rikenellaceae bacterium]
MKTKSFFISVAVLFALLISTNLYAQPGGGGGGMGGGGGGMGGPGGGGPGMQQQTQIDFVASAGLFLIDTDKVIKKCKVNDEALVAQITALIDQYSSEYDKINIENYEQVKALTEMQEAQKSAQGGQGGGSDMRSQMQSVMSAVPVIKEKTIPMHKKLSEGISSLLDEKSAKRWETYYKNLCEDNMFSTESRQQGGRGERPEGDERPEGGERPERPDMQ